jgi:hypothetical protein
MPQIFYTITGLVFEWWLVTEFYIINEPSCSILKLYHGKKCPVVILLPFLMLINAVKAQKITGCGYKVPPRSWTTKFQSVYEKK